MGVIWLCPHEFLISLCNLNVGIKLDYLRPSLLNQLRYIKEFINEVLGSQY